ncbi:MAG: response regulator transcription factor [Bacteroidetes bacterium]|nr:response regulator transcription factor [Bacteroidota bacterium]
MDMRLMIVDDNAGMREMVRDAICTSEDTVMECADGTDAVLHYDTFKPAVVLMDVEMRYMDGFTAAERILSIDPAARIIFVSSHNTSAFRLKANRLRAAGFVSKENLSELQNLIHH